MINTDIFKIVQLLISNYKCIVIPNLGAFILNKENNNRMIAPLYKLSFNSQLIHDDGILATYFQKRNNISYDKALIEIQYLVQDIKTDLSDKKEVVCANLGTLQMQNDSITYKNNPSFVIPSSFGLSSITLHTISAIENKKAKQLVDKKKFRFKQNLLAASVGAAAVLLFLIPTNFIRDNTNNGMIEQANFLTNISSIYNNNTPKNKIESYYLIVDSEKDLTKANSKLQQLKNNFEFDNATILANENTQRIYIQKYTSKNDANKALNDLKSKNPRFSNAWIFTETAKK